MRLSLINWKLETRKIKDLKPFKKNPRRISKHDAANLQKSIQEFGLIDKPIITPDGMIIGGHQRVAMLKKIGVKEVECHVPVEELTDAQIKGINVGMNRIHGDFDFDILANEFEVEELLANGFSEEDLSIAPIEEIASEEASEKKNKEKLCPNCGHQL